MCLRYLFCLDSIVIQPASITGGGVAKHGLWVRKTQVETLVPSLSDRVSLGNITNSFFKYFYFFAPQFLSLSRK